jgi:protein TonB
MLSPARFLVPTALGGLFTVGMFWVLWHLISGPVDVGELREATRIEFSRMRRDTDLVSRRQEKVERERPPVVPEVPRLAFSASNVSGNVAQLTPMVDARGAMSRMTLSAGSDQDVLPLVRIAPDYPPRALSRGIEGWVIVQFTITETGSVRDASVVDADPEEIFDQSALNAIARWRYNPRVEGGVAIERVGVQTIIRFELED